MIANFMFNYFVRNVRDLFTSSLLEHSHQITNTGERHGCSLFSVSLSFSFLTDDSRAVCGVAAPLVEDCFCFCCTQLQPLPGHFRFSTLSFDGAKSASDMDCSLSDLWNNRNSSINKKIKPLEVVWSHTRTVQFKLIFKQHWY